MKTELNSDLQFDKACLKIIGPPVLHYPQTLKDWRRNLKSLVVTQPWILMYLYAQKTEMCFNPVSNVVVFNFISFVLLS